MATNQALGSFLRANVAAHVKNILADTNPKDGFGILRRLQEIYAPASIKDHNKAITYLQQLQMHPKDTITNFVTKYNRALKTLADVSIGFAPPSEYDRINMFIQKCLNTITEGSDIRLTLLHYERIIVNTHPNGKLPFTMCELKRDLCQHENTLGKNKHTSRHQQHETRNNKYSNEKRRHA